MGCANSKEMVCKNCQAPLTPVTRRSHSMHVHHSPETDGGSHHVVELTSSTLGSLKLDPLRTNHYVGKESLAVDGIKTEKKKISREDFANGVIEAKIWSKMVEEKIPRKNLKTPIQTPPGEPETINTWELMEGLEESSPLIRPQNHIRSFSFHVASNQSPSYYDSATPKVKENGDQTPKQMWELSHNDRNMYSDGTSEISEFDPEVISTFRKALQELPPANPFHLKPLMIETEPAPVSKNREFYQSDVKKVKAVVGNYDYDKLVLYFTSLRGVRKTFEDCCNVRVILKGLGVKVDERDVSMHSGFREELKELLGEGYSLGGLPKVFIGAKYIGGAEEIRRMHDSGQLEKVVECCEKVEDGGGSGGVCEACWDIRFVPCETCSGSCKIYCEGEFDEENEEDGYGFQRCPDCNENGLILCPICWD